MKTNLGIIWVCVVLGFSTVSCRYMVYSKNPTDLSGAMKTQPDILHVAHEVVQSFKNKDGQKLATFVHPVKGVRFSPTAFVDVSQDRVFYHTEIARFWDDKNNYFWGYADGSGEPINMTPQLYCERYVLDRDFLKLSTININNDQAYGNTVNNAATIYPIATRVEFYIHPSNAEKSDWSALRLVFENFEGRWFLLAVIHDEWST